MDFWEFLPFGPYTAPATHEQEAKRIANESALRKMEMHLWISHTSCSRQLGVAKRNLTEYGAKKKILFFIYFDIINLTKLLENING